MLLLRRRCGILNLSSLLLFRDGKAMEIDHKLSNKSVAKLFLVVVGLGATGDTILDHI